MKKPFLEVTYRGGKPFAAYLYLDRLPNDRAVRTERRGPFAVDYAGDGRAIGIEFIETRSVNLALLNELLSDLQQSSVAAADVAPLVAA